MTKKICDLCGNDVKDGAERGKHGCLMIPVLDKEGESVGVMALNPGYDPDLCMDCILGTLERWVEANKRKGQGKVVG